MKFRAPSLMLFGGLLLVLPLALPTKTSAKQYPAPLPLSDTANWITSDKAGIVKERTTTANTLGSPQSVAGLKQRHRGTLPQTVTTAVLREASQRTGLPTSRLRIEKFQRIQGSSGCLGLPPRLGEFCTADLVGLWQVTVVSGQQRLVYHTNLDGSYMRLNEAASNNLAEASLPQTVTTAVLREASQRTGLPTSRLRIEKFQRIQGSSSCLGLPPRPGEGCTRDLAQLWQVTVASGQQRLVYHSNLDGSRIKLNPTPAISIQ